jgi:bifunctional non-homologous end joining protein LigD
LSSIKGPSERPGEQRHSAGRVPPLDYRSGRNDNWVKRTCRERDTFVLVGVAYKQRNKFDGIYLGRREGKQVLYAGKVENGFDDDDEKKLAALTEQLKTRTQPLTKKIKKPKAVWLKPEVLVDVEYRALTGEKKVRHPSFVGFREDLSDGR